MKTENIKTKLDETLRKAGAPHAKAIRDFFTRDNELRIEAARHNVFAAEDAYEQTKAAAISGDAKALAEITSDPTLRDFKRKFAALEEIHEQARTNHAAENRKHFVAAAEAMLPRVDEIAALAQSQFDGFCDATGEERHPSRWASEVCPSLKSFLQAVIRGSDCDLSPFAEYV